MKTNDVYKKLFEDAKDFYNGVEAVKCPALNSSVHFTADGFHHLRFSNSRSGRTKKERRNKFAFLREAVEILKISTTFQEYRLTTAPIGTMDSKGFRTMTKIEFYGFWAVRKRKDSMIRVKVIVRRVINSDTFIFWSLMPDWTEKTINGQTIRYFASPDIEEE